MVSRLGRRLKQYRELAGFTQNELAKRADVSRPIISNVERGTQDSMTLDNAGKLAKALGISIDLLAGQGQDDSDLLPTTPVLAASTVWSGG